MAKNFKDDNDMKILPLYSDLTRSKVKGKKEKCTVTLTQSTINEGDTLYVKVPKLAVGDCIIPGSLKVTCKLENKNTKSRFLNNISALLHQDVTVKLGNTELYHNVQENKILVYKDLWQSERSRKCREAEVIASENTRKLMSGDDSGSGTGSASNIEDKMIADLYKDRLEIPIGHHVLGGQGIFAPRALDADFDVDIRFAMGKDIMEAQTSQSIAGYKVTNLNLEYEKIRSQELYDKAEQSYISGRTWPYRFIEKPTTNSADWLKSKTDVTSRVNLPRRSMNAIVMLFRDDAKDSEKFVYPNIDSVEISIEGVPNALYTKSMGKHERYETARDFFLDDINDTITPREFFKDKFALVIDMRTVNDKNVYANGREILNTQDGVAIQIKKKATTKDLTCYMYVISDAQVSIQNKNTVRVEK